MGHYFKVIQIRMEHWMNLQLQELDLTASQGQIIGYLTHAKQPPCARDLEEFFRLSHPTVSGLLSRMESKGFIQIRPDEHDKRIKRIYLLEKGMACSRQIAQSIEDNESRMLRGFSEEEADLFQCLLRRAIDNMNDDTVPPPQKREE